MKMNGAGIAEVSEKGTVGKSVEVFGDCCSRIYDAHDGFPTKPD